MLGSVSFFLSFCPAVPFLLPLVIFLLSRMSENPKTSLLLAGCPAARIAVKEFDFSFVLECYVVHGLLQYQGTVLLLYYLSK